MKKAKRGKSPRFHRGKVDGHVPLSEFEGPPHKVVIPPVRTPDVGPTAQPRGGFFDFFFPGRPARNGDEQ